MKITIWYVVVSIRYSRTGDTYDHEEMVVAETRRKAIRALIGHDEINPRLICKSSAIEKETVILGV